MIIIENLKILPNNVLVVTSEQFSINYILIIINQALNQPLDIVMT